VSGSHNHRPLAVANSLLCRFSTTVGELGGCICGIHLLLRANKHKYLSLKP
jgi:hypothetical protein